MLDLNAIKERLARCTANPNSFPDRLDAQREDVPALIAEVEALRRELAECYSVIGGLRVREEHLRQELADHPACTIGCSTCDGAMDAMDAFDAAQAGD